MNNEQNGHAPASDFQVNPAAVIESLGQQVARLTVELAMRDAALAGIRAELEELRRGLEAKAKSETAAARAAK